MTKAKLLVLGLALCVMATPASAMPDLFGFSFSNTRDTFDGVSSFSTMDWANTAVDVYRNTPPAGSALLLPTLWGSGSEDFLLSMTITNITATTADGSGSFTIEDTEGDIIAGTVTGVWTKDGSGGKFSGSPWNVTYTSAVDDTFDGHLGTSASMIFDPPQPWGGSIVEMTTDGAWFKTNMPFDMKGGSVDATVGALVGTTTVIPAPGAFLLGLFGLSAVGLRPRKFT